MRRVDNAKQSLGAGGAGGTFNNYQFDFGLGNGFAKGSSNAPLKDQKPSGFESPWSTPQVPKSTASQQRQQQPAYSGWSGSGYQASSTSWASSNSAGVGKSSGGLGGFPAPSSQTSGGKPALQSGWAGYQPMTPGLGVGAKPAASGLSSLNNSAPMSSSLRSDISKLTGAGIVGISQNQTTGGKDVFGDLLGPSLNRSNAPLNSQPAAKPAFLMGKLDASLPKVDDTRGQSSSNAPMSRMKKPAPAPAPASAPEPSAVHRPQSGAERDPFPPVSISSASNVSFQDDVFSFQTGGPAPGTTAGFASANASADPFGLSGSSAFSGAGLEHFGIGGQSQRVPPPQTGPTAGSFNVSSGDPFDVFSAKPSSARPQQYVDPLESFLGKSTPPSTNAAPSPASMQQQDDGWGVFGDAAGSSTGGNEPTTTELEGLPPPPSGITAQAATAKGSDFYKNGQFPDAIKWLSWSVELLGTNPDKGLLCEVLTCRVSCYKEIGEMKKAVADCTKAIDLHPDDISLIMLRSNLYESMEKYKLGVADLKRVLKIDSSNRQARLTLMRLEKMM